MSMMDDKRHYTILGFFILLFLLMCWTVLQYPEKISYLSHGQIPAIMDIICYTLFSIAIVSNVAGKMRLGKQVFFVQTNQTILNAPLVLFLVYLFLLIVYGIHTSWDRMPMLALVFLTLLTLVYRGYAYEIREKGIVMGSAVYRWNKIQQINIEENKIEKNKIEKNTCSIKRNNGKLVPCNIDLLENNRNEILDLLREKTAVNLINDGQECAAHSMVLAEQATRLH